MHGLARTLLFDEDFDLPTPHARVAPPPPPRAPDDRDDEITRLHALLVDTRDEAHADGVAAGLAQAQAQHRDDLRRALEAIACGIAAAEDAASRAAERAARDVAQLLLAALGAVMPELLHHHGDAEAAAVARALLPALLLHEPAVTIRCNPCTLPALETELAALEDDLATAVRLVAADQLPPGDIRLSWPDGRARRSVREVWSDMTQALAPLLSLPPLPDNLAPPPEPAAANDAV